MQSQESSKPGWRRVLRIRALLYLAGAGILVWFLLSYASEDHPYKLSPYPDGKNFAFTITHDADQSKMPVVRAMYNFLDGIGMRTTVAVWVQRADRADGMPDNELRSDRSLTLEDPEYRSYMLQLHKKGFEIGLHTVSRGNDLRSKTIEGYEEFHKTFGFYPKMNIMHSRNLENVYWGRKVFSHKLGQWIVGDLMARFAYEKASFPFSGEDPNSQYFWGDILRDKTKYVRLWGTQDINTLKFNPSMPYHDPEKPHVNFWFSFSNGSSLQAFRNLTIPKNVNKLTKERGACIVYAHFGTEYLRTQDGGTYVLDEQFKRQLESISTQKDGWFVPASVLLDRLLAIKNVTLVVKENALIVANSNPFPVEGITLLVPRDVVLEDLDGRKFRGNEEGEIVLRTLAGNQSITLFKNSSCRYVDRCSPTFLERLRLITRRIFVGRSSWSSSHQ